MTKKMDDEFADVFGDYDFSKAVSLNSPQKEENSYNLLNLQDSISPENTTTTTLSQEKNPISFLDSSDDALLGNSAANICIDDDPMEEKERMELSGIDALLDNVKKNDAIPFSTFIMNTTDTNSQSTASWSRLAETEQEDFLAWLGEEDKSVDKIFTSISTTTTATNGTTSTTTNSDNSITASTSSSSNAITASSSTTSNSSSSNSVSPSIVSIPFMDEAASLPLPSIISPIATDVNKPHSLLETVDQDKPLESISSPCISSPSPPLEKKVERSSISSPLPLSSSPLPLSSSPLPLSSSPLPLQSPPLPLQSPPLPLQSPPPLPLSSSPLPPSSPFEKNGEGSLIIPNFAPSSSLKYPKDETNLEETTKLISSNVLTHEGAVIEIKKLLSKDSGNDNEEIRSICLKLGYIPQECRHEVWPRLLNVKGRRNSLTSLNSIEKPSSLCNEQWIKKDVEMITKRVMKLRGLASDQEESYRNQLEQLLSLFCLQRSMTYFPGIGETFSPLLLVAETPNDPMVFNCMYALCSEVLPYLLGGISCSQVANARRPMLNLLMLYHDPSLSRFLDHHYPNWTSAPIISSSSPTTKTQKLTTNSDQFRHPSFSGKRGERGEGGGVLSDSWISSLLEEQDRSYDELLPIWDRILLKKPILPIYTVFFILGLLISKKEDITRRSGCVLEDWIKGFIKCCLEDISFISDCCDLADGLDALTPMSFKQKMIQAGMQDMEEHSTSLPKEHPSMSSDTEKQQQKQKQKQQQQSSLHLNLEEDDHQIDDKEEEEDSKKEEENANGMTLMRKRLNVSLSDLQTKLFDQLSPTSKQDLTFQSGSIPMPLKDPEFFCITVCAGEVVPSVIQGRKKPSDNKIKYFVVDCRSSDLISQGRLPTAFHLDPEALIKSDLTDLIVGTLGPFRRNVHICVMGQGSGCPSSVAQRKDSFLDFMAKDASQVNDAVLFLTKHRFPYVSVLEGGYTAVHSFLADCPAYNLSDLADHSAAYCYICGGNPCPEVPEGPLSPPAKYLTSLTGALKDGKGWLSRQKSSMEKSVTDLHSSEKLKKNWLSRNKEEDLVSETTNPTNPTNPTTSISSGNIGLTSRTSGILDRILLSKSTSDGSDGGNGNECAVSPTPEGKSLPLPSFLANKFKSSSSHKINEESTTEISNHQPMSRASSLANSSRSLSNRLKSTLISSLKKDSKNVTTSSTSLKWKGGVVESGEDSVFTIDDDLEDEEVTSSMQVASLCEGMLSGVTKGDTVKMEDFASLAKHLVFPCYKKKKIGGSKCAMLPRYISVVENCIVVLKSCEKTKGIAVVKSNHHVQELTRMTFQKKNLQMINLYYRSKQDQQPDQQLQDSSSKNSTTTITSVAYQIERRDDFIAALKECMQALAS